MSHHRWELIPLGNIPHDVLSILLGAHPKVPDPRREEEAIGRQYSTHDDRLSEDDEDEDTSSPLNKEQGSHRQRTAGLESELSQKNGRIHNTEEDDTQRSWNVPDDEWEWSDEDPSSFGSNWKGVRPASSTAITAKRTSSSTISNRSQRSPPTSIDNTSSRNTTGSTSLSALEDDGSVATSLTGLDETLPLSVAQDLHVSVCDSGQYIACASKKMFAILKRQSSTVAIRSSSQDKSQRQQSSTFRHEWTLVGKGSSLDTPLDEITTVLCLPLYVPRSKQSQIYVVVGYKSGMIRIFNEHGVLVVVQQLHHTPVVSIKARIGVGKVPGEDEDEMTILHEGGKVVCIEGESLWVVLRLCNGSTRPSDNKYGQTSQAPTFAYKKWSLQNQDLMVDVISCGPARRRPTLSNGFSSSSSSSLYTSQATERFVSAGSQPMMAFYASSSSSRPLFSATSLATQMAARVTSAVFGFAKSIWNSAPSPRPGSPAVGQPSGNASGQGMQDGTVGPYGNVYSSAMAPATEVPAVLWLSDSQRCIRHVSLAPAPPRGTYYHHPSKLAAMTDSLGRVLLVDLEECEIIRMWKGLRGARCGWIQEERIVRTSRGNSNSEFVPLKRHLVLYLVIYAPKRGTVEIYPARQGKRVGLIQVGLGWKICTTFASPIGKPALLAGVTGPSRTDEQATPSHPIADPPGLSQCLLIGPSGEVRRVVSHHIQPSKSIPPSNNSASATT